MMTKRFVTEALERAVKTAAQSALLLLGADQISAFDVDYGQMAGFALGGFILSLLTSIASKPLGPDDGSASVV
jgi:hypothetical protein